MPSWVERLKKSAMQVAPPSSLPFPLRWPLSGHRKFRKIIQQAVLVL